jgi:hypothetical protein
MKRVFYSIALVLFCSWVLTCFVFHVGGGIHVLILLALICLLHAIITIPRKKYMVDDMKQQDLEAADTMKEQRA